jgi:hypothetical protein
MEEEDEERRFLEGSKLEHYHHVDSILGTFF